MGQEQQLRSQKTHTHVFTYLGLPCGKHLKRRFTMRGKGTGFDSRYQDAALLSLCSGCCRWMSHRAGKRSTLIMELHQFVTVPEISWRDTDLYCSVITTRMRTAPSAQHQGEPPVLPVRLEFPWQHPVPVHIGSTFLPLPIPRDVQRENQKVTCSGLYPCCEADPCAGMTKEDWSRAARAQWGWNQSSHLTDKRLHVGVLITHHFVQPIQKAAPHLLCEPGKGLLLDLLNCVMERATDALSLLKCYRDKVRVSAASWKQAKGTLCLFCTEISVSNLLC